MKRNLKELIKGRWLGLALLLFTCWACYEDQEGCLDVAATNFFAEADDPCPDCCTYPSLAIDIRHRVVLADTFFNLVYVDSIYTDDFGNPFRINNIQFYLSNFRLLRASNTEVGVADSLNIAVLQSGGDTLMQNVEDNFALINRSNFNAYTLGTFLEAGNFAGIRLAMGVEGAANNADPNLISNSHPLSIEEDMYFNPDSGYVFNRIEFFRDTTAADTIPTVINIGLEQNLRSLVLLGEFNLLEGFNTTLTLQIDYLTWFRGVDIKNDSEEIISSKIVDNITQAISLIAIEQDLN